MSATAIEVKRITAKDGIKDWLLVPQIVLGDDPAWVQPLDLAERQRISPSHNPFFAFGDAVFFVAYKDGRPAGRISAQVNKRHLAQHGDQTGHFGFFDCIDDVAVARSLFAAAEQWLLAQGLRCMQGPFNLTINQDAGLLVSGFESRPVIMTSHAPRYAPALVEACGLRKVIDLLAYRTTSLTREEKIVRLGKMASDTGRVKIRNIRMSRYAEEARLLFDIFNDAWSDNWGFTPFSPDEARATANELRPFMRSKFGWIAEIDGEPAAMAVILPDLNEVIAPFGGKLLPLNWARLAYAVWNDDWHSARVPLLGVRKRHRGSPLATGVLSLLVAELFKLSRHYGEVAVEFSWVLETNRAMTAITELATGPPTRVYRIYEKAIGPSS